MARLRISSPASRDLKHILEVSLDRWGKVARDRYAALLAAALKAIAGDPHGRATRDRAQLVAGVRSLHLRNVRGAGRVRDPVHVVFFRLHEDVVEIVRVLHERMEPALHLAASPAGQRKPIGR